MNPQRLADDGLQRFLLGGIGFMVEQVLSLAGDDGEGIVDLMPGAGGELGQRLELAGVQALFLGRGLFLKGAVQLVQVTFESFVDRSVAQPAILGRQQKQIAQER